MNIYIHMFICISLPLEAPSLSAPLSAPIELIGRSVKIKWFQKVNSLTKSSSSGFS